PDDRFLGNRRFIGVARPAEERRAEERHRQRNPERDAVVEVVPQQQRNAGAEGSHLRQCQIDEYDFTSYYMKSEVNQKRRKEKAGHEWPLHYFPRYRPVGAHFCAPSPVASARTMLSTMAKYVVVLLTAPGCCGVSRTLAPV